MWDIKFMVEQSMLESGNFHLNHVGYKDITNSPDDAVLIFFHLNHVGYKGWILSLRKKPMINFHLNHVGYKERRKTNSFLRWKTFIWTMWDIKLLTFCRYRNTLLYFHLNHVGYKAYNSIWVFHSLYYFHLNHVGYKVLDVNHLKKLSHAFIWTMWDIK